MANCSRRDLLKGGFAASAASLIAHATLSSAETAVGGEPSLNQEAPETSVALENTRRERLLLDFGWRFTLGDAKDSVKDFQFGNHKYAMGWDDQRFAVADPAFDDAGWKRVDLPHDWAVELPFVYDKSLEDHGFKPLGENYPGTSIGWYRRVFDIPASDAGKRIAIEFDGVFRDASVIVNEHFVGRNRSGYAPFRLDVTDYIRCGEKNCLVVRVDATRVEGWFYEGAGIYRHVWLTKTDPVHLAHWGTCVRTEVNGDRADVNILTEVENETDSDKTCLVLSRILDASGNTVAAVQSDSIKVPAGTLHTFETRTVVQKAALWSLEAPNLYRLISSVQAEGAITDRDEVTFGIRTIHFDPDKGFFLNGKSVKIKGTCNHQEHAGVGAAMPDRLHVYQLERLKEMNSNGCRTSHNPATPAFLDACDRMGILVLEETRLFSSSEEGLSQLTRMIRRDRNRPSIFLWSIGNEEWEQGSELGRRMAETMKRLAHTLDPTRPITLAQNRAFGQGVSPVLDVQGFNYNEEDIDPYHKKFPRKPLIGTETAVVTSTRGIYIGDKDKGHVSSYTLEVERWWKFYDERPFLSGAFLWVGFDYRRGPVPFGWPCISSNFGVLDVCGFPKDDYFYYQAWWGQKPVVHLFPHWNWPGKEGQEIAVWCHTNLDEVELFLNGKSVGSQKVQRNTHVEWKVKYAPGFIEARGSKDGVVVAKARRETTGPAAKLVLRPDRSQISADGRDISIIAVEVQDTEGRLVPTANNEVTFKVEGAGRLIGVGNGDPSCHEADKGEKRSAFNGLCMAIVQSLRQPGAITIEASSRRLERAVATVTCAEAKPYPLVL